MGLKHCEELVGYPLQLFHWLLVLCVWNTKGVQTQIQSQTRLWLWEECEGGEFSIFGIWRWKVGRSGGVQLVYSLLSQVLMTSGMGNEAWDMEMGYEFVAAVIIAVGMFT